MSWITAVRHAQGDPVMALMWTIGEAHRRPRDLLVWRLDGLLFWGTVHPSQRQPILDAYRALAGDTHVLCLDHDTSEVFEGRIDRSGRKYLH